MILLIYILCVILLTAVHYSAFNALHFGMYSVYTAHNARGDALLFGAFFAMFGLVGLFIVFCETNFFQYGFKWKVE